MTANGHPLVIRKDFKPQMDWAVFLDRDGVLNEEVHLLHDVKDLRLLPQAAEAIRSLNAKNIPCIVVHNAAAVSRGLCSIETANTLNAELERLLNNENACLDAIYTCPHHPTAFASEYQLDCPWRKPRSGMLKDASSRFGFNLKKSYLIGDTARDLLAAQNVGTFAILVATGHAGKDADHHATPDHACPDVLTAVNYILQREKLT